MILHDEALLYDETGSVGLITFNRQDRLNTFRRRDYEMLLALLQSVRNSSVRSLVISGTGRAFSAGQDLSEIEAGKISDAEDQESLLKMMQDITRILMDMDIPTITAFNGFAVGAGLEIALACDFRIGVPESYFMFAEVRRGLFPTNGVLWLLPRLVGLANAREMLLTGRKFNAAHALRAGLLNEVVPADQLRDRAMELASELSDNSLDSIAGIKSLLRITYDVSLEEMMQCEIDHNRAMTHSPDFAEGVSAFLEKRMPDFRRERS